MRHAVADALQVLRRRAPTLAVTGALAAAATFATAFLLPPVYRSSATILIQEQEIPQELVRSTVTSYADERIQVIAQQVLTRATLLALVERYSLYGAQRRGLTTEELVDRMRRDIRLQPISAEVTDRRTGSPAKTTIAFSLAYESEVAANAQKIAGELTTLFLNENLKTRQQKAAETTLFLDEELQRVAAYIGEVEQRLAEFKRRHQGRTPDLGVSNVLAVERADADLKRIEREIDFLTQRREQLQAQLVQTRPTLPLGAGGSPMLEPEDRLRALQMQLAAVRAQFNDQHPDVRRLQREISMLKASGPGEGTGSGASVLEGSLAATVADRERERERAEQDLAQLRQRYTDDHPDVQRARRLLAAAMGAESAARAALEATPPRQAPRSPDNPAWVALKGQIETITAQLGNLDTERGEVQQRYAQLGARVAQAPEVERELLELVRELDAARARFRDLRDKKSYASIAEQLERSRKAERFTVIEPPFLPERPSRPNRALIIGLGLLLTVAAAAGAAVLREALDPRVHGERAVARILNWPVLAAMPSAGALRHPAARRAALQRRLAWVAGTGLLATGAAALALHVWFMPLDVAWFSALRRLGL